MKTSDHAATRKSIQAHAVARLSAEGSRKFVEALKNPPAPNEKLRDLVREFGDEVGQ